MLTKLSELHSLNLMREANKEIRLIADFASWWDRNALRWPHKLALFDSRQRLTWEGAARAARCLSSALLALGLRPGEVVASWLPNWVESYILHTACEHAGLAWLPIPVSLREYEVKPILERVEARALFVAGRWHRMNYVEAIRQMRCQLPHLKVLIGVRTEEKGDLLSWEKLLSEEGKDFPRPKKPGSLILPTSGSTGVPKFAYFSASSWLLRGRLQAELFRLQPEDLFLAMAEGIGPSIPPLFAAPVAGSGVILASRLEAEEILALLQKEKVAIVCAVPAQLATLAYHPAWKAQRCRSVRLWYTTGAPMPQALAEKIEKETSAVVLSGYGGMDFGGWTAPSLDDPAEIRHRTVGRPRGDTEIRLVDEQGQDIPPGEIGEIWGRGPCCALGYYKDKETSREKWTNDGWFRTGDLGRWDAHGNLIMVGRKREIIRRGARTIVPKELEDLLMTHPKVLKAAVIGLPDLVMNERVCACVLPRSGQSFSFEEMVDFLKEQHVAPYKWPERLEVLKDIPLRGDKTDKETLRNEVLRRVSDSNL